MKKFSKILMSGLAALCLWACSDEANVSQPANAENDVYVEFGVQLMQGSSSRSTTTDGEDGNGSNSTGGAEVGKNYENSVKEILFGADQRLTDLSLSVNVWMWNLKRMEIPQTCDNLDRSALETYKTGEIYAYASVIPFLLSISMI